MLDTAPAGTAAAPAPLIIHLARGREWRGGERQVIRLALALGQQGRMRQLLVTAAGSTLARAARDAGIPLVEASWRVALDPRVVGSTLRRVRAANSPVVLHAHDSHALVLGVLASRFVPCPLVATRRSTTAPGRLWRVPDRVIAISGAVEATLRLSGIAPSRIALIPSGVDLPAIGSARAMAVDCGDADIIAVGALTREKGHRLLVEAFALVAKRLPKASLTILGEGPERGPIETLIRRRGLGGRVTLPGETGDPATRLARATVMVQPSVREALGTAVLESMAAGVPVIATAVGGLNELLDGGAGVLVPPGDAPALAEAIIALADDPAQREVLRRRAAQRVRRYDILGMAEQCTQVYRSALNRPGS